MSDTESVEVTSSRAEPLYDVGSLQKVPLASQPMIQSRNQGLAFSRDGCNPITLSSLPYHPPCGVRIGGETKAAAPGVNAGEVNVNICGSGGAEHLPVKKKGRPRKYRPASAKKSQGRPPGSCNKKHQLGALGSGGTGFVPHIITVKAGQDVFSRIMSSLQHGAKDVCIISGNGAISRVALRQPHIYGGTVVYEGRFEILSLSGSFVLSETGGLQSRTGGLSVSLSGSEGQVLGGAVAGLLVAASSVQTVVVMEAVRNQRKQIKSNHCLPHPSLRLALAVCRSVVAAQHRRAATSANHNMDNEAGRVKWNAYINALFPSTGLHP